MFVYLQSFLIVLLETLCCKIFYEAFGKKRLHRSRWKDYGLILLLVIIIYFSAMCLANYFVIKQAIIITVSAIIFYIYMNVSAKISLILSILFQSFLLVVDYFAYAIIRILFLDSVIIKGRFMTESILVVIFGKIILFLFVLIIKKNIGDKSVILSDSEWI